jgi:hypothetical protein
MDGNLILSISSEEENQAIESGWTIFSLMSGSLVVL